MLAFARWFGMPVNATRSCWYGRWDGKDLALRALTVRQLCHEIGHWVVATPKHRRLPNFGLGRALDARGERDAVRAVLVHHETHYESLASLCGIVLEACLNDPLSPFETTLTDHQWQDSTPDDVRKLLSSVQRKLTPLFAAVPWATPDGVAVTIKLVQEAHSYSRAYVRWARAFHANYQNPRKLD